MSIRKKAENYYTSLSKFPSNGLELIELLVEFTEQQVTDNSALIDTDKVAKFMAIISLEGNCLILSSEQKKAEIDDRTVWYKDILEKALNRANFKRKIPGKVVDAIKLYLKYGDEEKNKRHNGYYSAGGWPYETLSKFINSCDENHKAR